MDIAKGIPSVNYHLWRPCNMRCEFCFAIFQDIDQHVLPKGHLGREGCILVVESLADAGFKKINFAGGEPTLCPWLPELIRKAKLLGLTTSIVTNGSRITAEWLDAIKGGLDWIALSIDSVEPGTLLKIGRTTISGPMSEEDYMGIVGLIRRHEIRLKINTVVTRRNLEGDLRYFIVKARPERWKLLQVLPVSGQNDPAVGSYLISREEFDSFVRLCQSVESHGIEVVPESNDLMTGSYVMVDPAGRFFDNVSGTHSYGRSIIDVGVDEALKDVSVDPGRFLARSGLYDW